MGNLQKMVQVNLFAKQKQNHQCRKQTVVTMGEEGGINWEIKIDIYIPP